MLTVSSAFKTAIKQQTVRSDGKVDIINSSGTLSFDSSKIVRIEIFGTAFINEKVLGNLAQHSLTLELLGDQTKNISLSQETIVQPYIGVVLNTGTEYVQYQDFLITEIKYSDTTNLTTIVGTDSLVKLNTEFVDTNTYPMSLKAYVESVLTYVGLDLENATFFNDDFSVESQPFVNGTLAKDIIAKASELALCFVQVNKVSNKIEFVDAFSPFSRPATHEELEDFTHLELENYTHYDLERLFPLDDESVSKDNYWSFKISDYPYGRFGFNTVVLKTSQVEGENVTRQDDELVAEDGNIPLTIVDNNFINTEDLRELVVDDMLDHIDGYKYYPYSLEYRGFPYIEIGDIVVITRMDNTEFFSPVYELDIRYDGGLYGKLSAKALSLTQTKYLNTKSLSQRVKTAEIKVDKVEGEVTILAGDYYDGKLVGTYYNFDGTAFTITNADEEVVFSADNQGNLTLIGDIKTEVDGIVRTELNDNSLKFYGNTGNLLANFYTSFIEGSIVNETFILSTDEVFRSVNGSASLRGFQYETSGNMLSSMSLWSNSENVTTEGIVGTTSIGNGIDGTTSAFLKARDSVNSIYSDVEALYSYGTTSLTLSSVNTITSDSSRIFLRPASLMFYNADELYLIWLGGDYKTITVDGSGFLKAT